MMMPQFVRQPVSPFRDLFLFLLYEEHGYKIRIVECGEGLFYQEGDRAMICDLDIHGYAIPIKSIKKWDDGTKITEEERDRIKERIRLYFLKFQDGSHVTFS